MKKPNHRALLLLSLAMFSAQLGGWSAPAPGQSAGVTNRLLVVAPRLFHPALQEFVAHKRTLLPTELLSLEDILQKTSGVDDPEKLKRFLYAQWCELGLGYVLLVGDVDVLPVRFMVLDRVTPAAFDYAFYPSDLYYSDLAKPDGSFEDWNARKEGFHAGYFGEVRGEKNKTDPINFDEVDYLPEVAVGRWPVSTPAEARVVADKTVAYERMLLAHSGPHPQRAGFIVTGGWVDSRQLLDELAAKLSGAWQLEKRYYSDARRPSATPLPNHQQVCQLLNEGVSLVVHTGHGQPDGWDQCFSVGDLDHLTNAMQLPVIISAGCSTAYFSPLPPYEPYVDVDGKEHAGSDHNEVFKAPPPPPSPYQRGRFNPTGLGEQLLKRSMNGSVAYIGCNTGSQPCGLTLVEGFVNALAEAKEPRLGDCWASAIRHYFSKEKLATLKPNDDWYPPSIFFQGMKFMLFGDPSLRLPANRT
ncbi:MAG: C25 family cysteine peptidase [Limisphaerales bacterium]